MILLSIRSIFLTLLLLASQAHAAVTAWQISPKDSSITFTATQNNAPVTGQFAFSGEVNFDPADLAASNVNIIVNIGSITTSYQDVTTTLKTPEWFNQQAFPQATFKATSFTKTGGNAFEAKGTLTIRDKTIPITLPFVLEEYSATQAKATGSVMLKRTEFGIGQGDWAKTDEIKDDVQVKFVLIATKK